MYGVCRFIKMSFQVLGLGFAGLLLFIYSVASFAYVITGAAVFTWCAWVLFIAK